MADVDQTQSPGADHKIKQEPGLPESTVAPSANFPLLKAVIDKISPSELEKFKNEGLEICSQIKGVLQSHPMNEDISHWLEEIKSTSEQASPTTFEISVVGNTGHGKSSLINALLNEARLVPTSFMKACTSVVTKISWNESDDPDRRYYGEVIFMSSDEWRNELNQLLEDLKSSESPNLASLVREKKTSIGIAWSKLKAVYPSVTVEDILQLGSDELVFDSNVQSVLGQVKPISNSSCEPFYDELQKYVTSSPKVTSGLRCDECHNNSCESGGVRNDACEDCQVKLSTKRMALWPLIKVVNIFTKADVLSTGASFVDLPGYGDANSARSAIAEGYLERSDAIWIISDIIRAEDDKVAQDLLGRSFKQQLQYDGNLFKVTFICTKTDSVNADEALDSLESPALADAEERYSEAKSRLEQWRSKEQPQLKQDETRLNDLLQSGFYQEGTHEGANLLQTEAVNASSNMSSKNPKKTKAVSELPNQSKRQKVNSSIIDATIADLAEEQQELTTNDSLVIDITEVQGESTTTPVDSITEEPKPNEVQGFAAVQNLISKIKEAKTEHENRKNAVKEARHHLYASCVLERNTMSKKTIRREFANGIRELDQDNADSEAAGNTEAQGGASEESSKQDRDYSLLEQSLPVFCVSSRVYQMLSGRQDHSGDMTRGFTLESTEIPNLIKHAKDHALAERDQATKDFLNRLLQAWNSLHIWSNETQSRLEQSRKEVLNCAFTRLVADLDANVERLVETTRGIITDRLINRFDDSVTQAARQAPEVAAVWPKRMAHSTYKAVCRRLGQYSNNNGEYNFNRDLAYPLKKRLVKQWVETFQKDIPQSAEKSYTELEASINQFHGEVEQHMSDTAHLANLEKQLQSRIASLGRVSRRLGRTVKKFNKASSRKIEPGIKRSMTSIYQDCAAQSGTGMWRRIQSGMQANLRNCAASHFTRATKGVKNELNALIDTIEDKYTKETHNIIEGMRRDYAMVLPCPGDIEDESKHARKDMRQLLQNIDKHFCSQIDIFEPSDGEAS